MTFRLAGDFAAVTIFALVGVGFVFAVLAVSRVLAPHNPTPEKTSTYECGEVPIGDPWVNFHIRYYVIALLFMIFDIETVFLYPWALVMGKLGLFALVEMAIFIGILLVGWAYAWRRKALRWL